jgi:uncharacterized membrane protein
MDIPANVFNEDWLTVAGLALAWLLALAVRRAPWAYVLEHSHVYLGAIVFASFIWILRAGIGDKLNFHFLGFTVMTLMFGWRLALVAATAVVSISFWRLGNGWMAIPINVLVMGGIPILTTHTLLQWCQRHLPTNIFIFVFINAFVAGILSTIGVIFTGSLLLWLTETFRWPYLESYYLAYIPLLMIPEGLINGMLTSIAVVYAPQWIPAFDDTRYLRKRGE